MHNYVYNRKLSSGTLFYNRTVPDIYTQSDRVMTYTTLVVVLQVEVCLMIEVMIVVIRYYTPK